MRLKELATAFEQRKIEKKTFWTLAREKLIVLQECKELLEDNSSCEGIEINSSGIVLEKEGIKFYFDFSQVFCRAEANLVMKGDYEQEDFDFLVKVLPNDAIVFDVGANVGLFALNLAHNNTTANIYSFEPLPPTYMRLKRNLGLNRLEESRIQTFNVGMSNEDGEFVFYLPGEDEAASLQPLTDEFYLQKVNTQGLYERGGDMRRLFVK